MNTRVSNGCVLLLIAGLLNTAAAQINGISNGDLIRLTIPSIRGEKIVGEVVTMSTTHIHLSTYQPEIFIGAIEKLEVRSKIPKALRGTLFGAGFLGLFSGGVAVIANSSCEEDDFFSCVTTGRALVVGTSIGALTGAVLGGVVGGLQKDQMWKEKKIRIIPAPISLYDQNVQYSPGISLKWSFAGGVR